MPESGYLSPNDRSGLSRFMSKILRHVPEEFGVILENDWCDFELFCQAIFQQSYKKYTIENILYVVNHDPKQRFDIKNGKNTCNV